MHPPELTDPDELTRDYESWLSRKIPLDGDELATKHAEMRRHEYRFLRGTYYLWLDRVATELPEALERTKVPIVGDLHVENFGSWRDAEQVRRWGVNDFDELAVGSWLLDLLRLATSAVLAPHIGLKPKEISACLLEAWAVAEPGPGVDLTGKAAGPVSKLVPEFADPAKFYAGLTKGTPVDDLPAAVVSAAKAAAEPGWKPTWHVREAGTGSLGHRRRVGVGPAADGSTHAREVKELGPGTTLWAATRHHHATLPEPDQDLYARVSRAVRGPAGAARADGWQVRDLAPDVVRIAPVGLSGKKTARLLTAMAQATADVHGIDTDALRKAQGEAGPLAAADFHGMVKQMVDVVTADHRRYAR